jgi:hypothetical protein
VGLNERRLRLARRSSEASRAELDKAKQYSWPPPKYDYVPADRLSIVLGTSSRFFVEDR